jgi:hypothetical protein
VSGIRVQVCGDCHLLNFGGFATPERRIILDINDLDETLPAPWEWDVKRLVASFLLAALKWAIRREWPRCRGHGRQYHRRKMRDFAAMDVLDVWCARLDDSQFLAMLPQARRAVVKRPIARALAASSSELVYPELAEQAGGSPTSATTADDFSRRRSRSAGNIDLIREFF